MATNMVAGRITQSLACLQQCWRPVHRWPKRGAPKSTVALRGIMHCLREGHGDPATKVEARYVSPPIIHCDLGALLAQHQQRACRACAGWRHPSCSAL